MCYVSNFCIKEREKKTINKNKGTWISSKKNEKNQQFKFFTSIWKSVFLELFRLTEGKMDIFQFWSLYHFTVCAIEAPFLLP